MPREMRTCRSINAAQPVPLLDYYSSQLFTVYTTLKCKTSKNEFLEQIVCDARKIERA